MRFWKLFLILNCIFILLVVIFILTTNNFSLIWKYVNELLQNRFSTSAFHTLQRDRLIYNLIFSDVITLFLGLIVSLYLLKNKRFTLFLIVVAVDMLYQTSGMVFWGPKSLYDSPKLSFENILTSPQYRLLIRNLNVPYADYNSYWEALMVRAPFSDSFVDKQELQFHNQLSHLHTGLTPDWNMTVDVPVVNGYVTMIPQDYAQIWNTDNVVNINSLDMINPNDTKLKDWSVKYYLVDRNYVVNATVSGKLLASDSNIDLYEKEALPRFRYEDGTGAIIDGYSETPNNVRFHMTNVAKHTSLIIADRYDLFWKVILNGKVGEIENYGGMRKIDLDPNLQTLDIEFRYAPNSLRIGILFFISGAFIVLRNFVREKKS